MGPRTIEPLATVPAAQLVATASPVQWLVQDLLLDSGAAILGGAPKSGKTYLALDLCVAVASGTVAAGHFRALSARPVTLLCAEDPSPVLAARLAALARSRSVALNELALEVIVEPAVRLPEALPRLADPADLELRIEHRAAAGPQPLHLRLCVEAAGSTARFEARARSAAAHDPSASRLLALLEAATTPLSTSELRTKLGLRNQTVSAALRTLLTHGRINRHPDGWTLIRSSATTQ